MQKRQFSRDAALIKVVHMHTPKTAYIVKNETGFAAGTFQPQWCYRSWLHVLLFVLRHHRQQEGNSGKVLL